MASVRERRTSTGETRWAVLFRQGSKQTSKTFTTQKAANRFAKFVDALGAQEALAALKVVGVSDTTVGDLVDTHVNSLSGITEGTRSDYRAYRRDLGPLADLPIEALTRASVAKWVNDLSSRLSGKSIKNRHSLLSAALTRAQRDGIVPDNPCKGIRLPRSIKRDMTFLTHGEFAQLLGAVPDYWQPLVTTLAGTGMRWGEATALAVQDVDLDSDQPVIRVRRAYKHTDGNGRELGPPKTQKGRRAITIDRHVVDALRPLLKGRSADDLVFVNTYGRPITQSTFLVHVWRPALKKSGLTKTPRVHDLRHTHASWLIAGGVPLTFIQARLGHESIQTTSDTYGHLAPDAGRISAAVTSLALASAFPTIEEPPRALVGGQELVEEHDDVLGDEPGLED
jgi:integrase